MRAISFKMIEGAGITPLQCYEWVNEMLMYKREAILPSKISLNTELSGVFHNTMPCMIPRMNWAGVKLVTKYPQRHFVIKLEKYRD